MGINEVDSSDKQWGAQPPKKKWKYWYMSFGDDEKPNGEVAKVQPEVGESDPLSVPYKPSSHKSTMASLDPRPLESPPDRRPSLSSPCKEPEEHSPMTYRRTTAHAYSPTPVAAPSLGPLRSTPIQVPQQTFFTPSQDAFSTSPSISPSNSSSGGDSISPLGLVSAFRSSVGGSESPISHSSRRSMEPTSLSHVSSMEANSQYQLNGFIRPINGLGGIGASNTLDQDDDDDDSHEAKDDNKKRAGSTPSREVHNKLEKNRRAHLKECFETLRRQLPSMEDKKISNQTILKAAHRFILTLKRKEKEFEHEMERLARDKIAHQQQLSSLKKELQTKWDHLDFSTILPDMASLEQHRDKDTKSTTTASEQPDLEEDSRDSLRLSSNLTQNSEGSTGTYMHLSSHPVDLTPPSTVSEKLSFHHVDRDTYPDPNQPLNLSTNTPVGGRSPRRLPSPNPPSQIRANGEWPVRRPSPYSINYSHDKSTLPKGSQSVCKTISSPPMINAVPKLLNPSLGLNVTRMPPLSTNNPHISPVNSVLSTATVPTKINSTVTNLSQLVKAGTTVSHIPSITKVVTTLPHMSTLTPVGTTISNIPSSTFASNIGQIQISSSETSNLHSAVPIRANVAHISNIVNGGAAIARVSSSNLSNTTVTMASAEHQIPIVGGGGIQIPAHLVANGVHLTGATGGIIGQPAIQVITPEGYKLIPAEHAPNGIKPVAFTLAQPGFEHMPCIDDGTHTPVMVAMNKNGLSALHLTVPAAARTITSNSRGNSVPVTSVPLNLTVPGSAQTVKMTQTGSAPLISSYIPLTHANGLTRLVQGMSVVGPLVVPQSQRGGVVLPTNINAASNKVIKAHHAVAGGGGMVVSTTGGGTALPLAQYATTLTGGLMNSVVVVSAPATAPAVTSMAISTAKH